MRWVYFRVMALDLWRDKSTLVMAFVLPGVVFVIFASIFSAAAGGEITPRVAWLDLRQSEASQRLLAQLTKSPSIELEAGAFRDREHVLAAVRDGQVDVGVIVREQGSRLVELELGQPAPLEVVYDPLRGIAANLTAGVLQREWAAALPEAPIRTALRVVDERIVPLTAEQRAVMNTAFAAMATTADGNADSTAPLVDIQAIQDAGPAAPSVIYYAGGVGMLFLLLASLNGALSLLDDKESGLFDRLSMGPAGAGAMLYGRFLFLAVQGTLQVAVIYLVAWLLFEVDLPSHVLPWLAVTLAAASCVASLALCFTCLCNTRQQAQTLGHIGVLLLSAIGGSMVPRFLMPIEMQQLGWLTPNTWALEAYMAAFRGDPLIGGKAALGLCLLVVTAVLALIFARITIGRPSRRGG